jgi:hypothetical protein
MAFELPGFVDGTRPAGADLSSHQYKFVKLNSSGQVVICAAATDKPYGILQNKPTSGQAAEVMKNGLSKMIMAAGNTKGNVGGTDSSGLFAAYAFGTDTTKYMCAEVVEDADAASGVGTVAFDCFMPPRGA